MFWGSFHHIIAMVGVVLLLVDLALVSTYIDLLLGRVIELSFELCNFNPGGTELDILKVYGSFLQDYSQVNGATGALFKVAIGLLLGQMALVFFLGTDQVRHNVADGGIVSYSISPSRLRHLPSISVIWKMRYSLLLMIIAIGAEIASTYFTRIHGYLQNIDIYTYVTSARTGLGLSPSGTLPDLLIDLVNTYYISDSVPFIVTVGLFALVFGLSIGSTDPWRFMSKTIQVLGTLILLRAVTALCTIYPVPSTVLTTPDCYKAPYLDPKDHRGFQFMGFEAFSCNHSMFSIHAASTTACVWILILFIRYGPLRKNKWVPYSLLLLLNFALMLLPVFARVNYSVEAFIGAGFASILVLSQSAAYKVLFRFEQNIRYVAKDDGSGKPSTSELLNDRILPTLDECTQQLQLYIATTRSNPGLKLDPNELSDIVDLYKFVGDTIKSAKEAVPNVPMSTVGIAIPDELRKYKKKVVKTPTPPLSPDQNTSDAQDIVSMIAEAQQDQSNSQTIERKDLV